jgi:hypothetical protein
MLHCMTRGHGLFHRYAHSPSHKRPSDALPSTDDTGNDVQRPSITGSGRGIVSIGVCTLLQTNFHRSNSALRHSSSRLLVTFGGNGLSRLRWGEYTERIVLLIDLFRRGCRCCSYITQAGWEMRCSSESIPGRGGSPGGRREFRFSVSDCVAYCFKH